MTEYTLVGEEAKKICDEYSPEDVARTLVLVKKRLAVWRQAASVLAEVASEYQREDGAAEWLAYAIDRAMSGERSVLSMLKSVD